MSVRGANGKLNYTQSGVLMRWIGGAGRREFPFNLQRRRITGRASLETYTLPNTPLGCGSKRKWRTFFDFVTERAFEMKFPLCLFFVVSVVGQILQREWLLLSSCQLHPCLSYTLYMSANCLFHICSHNLTCSRSFPFKAANRAIYSSPICRSIWGLLLGHCRHPVLRWSCQGTLKIQWGKLTPTFNYRLALTASLPVHHPASPPSHQPALSFPIPTPDKSYL